MNTNKKEISSPERKARLPQPGGHQPKGPLPPVAPSLPPQLNGQLPSGKAAHLTVPLGRR